MSLNRTRCVGLLWGASLLAGCAEPAAPSAAPGEQVRADFEFQGGPIPAAAVGALLGELADPLPSFGAVDLEGFARANARANPDPPEDFFAYTCLGCSKSGIFVLRVYNHTSGTGVFSDLLLARLENDTVVEDGKERSRCLLRSVGRWTLGDRSATTVSFDGETLTIGPAGDRKDEVRLELK